jgi:hypothetical protein
MQGVGAASEQARSRQTQHQRKTSAASYSATPNPPSFINLIEEEKAENMRLGMRHSPVSFFFGQRPVEAAWSRL